MIIQLHRFEQSFEQRWLLLIRLNLQRQTHTSLQIEPYLQGKLPAIFWCAASMGMETVAPYTTVN